MFFEVIVSSLEVIVSSLSASKQASLLLSKPCLPYAGFLDILNYCLAAGHHAHMHNQAGICQFWRQQAAAAAAGDGGLVALLALLCQVKLMTYHQQGRCGKACVGAAGEAAGQGKGQGAAQDILLATRSKDLRGTHLQVML